MKIGLRPSQSQPLAGPDVASKRVGGEGNAAEVCLKNTSRYLRSHEAQWDLVLQVESISHTFRPALHAPSYLALALALLPRPLPSALNPRPLTLGP